MTWEMYHTVCQILLKWSQDMLNSITGLNNNKITNCWNCEHTKILPDFDPFTKQIMNEKATEARGLRIDRPQLLFSSRPLIIIIIIFSTFIISNTILKLFTLWRPFPTFEKVLWRLLMWRNKPSPQIHHHFNSPALLMKWQIIYEKLFSFSRWFILAQVITIHQVKSLPTALISILIPQFGYTTISLDYSALPWAIYMKSGFYLDFIFGVNNFLSIVM